MSVALLADGSGNSGRLQVNGADSILLLAGNAPAPVVGGSRNLKASLTAAGSSVTYTADEIVVKKALGGTFACLGAFSQTLNLATVGAGGMDTGAAPVSGFVAVYAGVDPTNGNRAIWARDATSIAAPEVYAGGQASVAAYTLNALIGVLPTNGSGQLPIFCQVDRDVFYGASSPLSTNTQGAAQSFAIATSVPKNAKKCQGYAQIISSTTPSNLNAAIGPILGGGLVGVSAYLSITNSAALGGVMSGFSNLPILTPQTLGYTATASAGTMTLTVWISGYTF